MPTGTGHRQVGVKLLRKETQEAAAGPDGRFAPGGVAQSRCASADGKGDELSVQRKFRGCSGGALRACAAFSAKVIAGPHGIRMELRHRAAPSFRSLRDCNKRAAAGELFSFRQSGLLLPPRKAVQPAQWEDGAPIMFPYWPRTSETRSTGAIMRHSASDAPRPRFFAVRTCLTKHDQFAVAAIVHCRERCRAIAVQNDGHAAVRDRRCLAAEEKVVRQCDRARFSSGARMMQNTCGA